MSASLACLTEREIVDLFAAKSGLAPIAGDTRGEEARRWATAAIFELCRRTRRPNVAAQHAVEICRSSRYAELLEPYVQRELSAGRSQT